MPKQNYKLASGSLSGGSTKKASPSILGNTQAMTSIRAPQLNSNVGKTSAPKAYVPKVLDNPVASAVQDSTNLLVNAAFKYNDRRNQLEADELVLAYKTKAREAYYGSEAEDGSYNGGYRATELKTAVDTFDTYRGGINQSAEEMLSSASPAVRERALLRINQAKQAAIERGADHNYKQLGLHENNVRYQERQDILKDVELNGPTAFTNGTVESHLDKFTSLQEREANEKYLAQQTMYMTYNDAIEAASNNTNDLTPAVTAYNNAYKAFEAIRPQLSEGTENALQNWMEGKKNLSIKQAKSELKRNTDRRKMEVDRDMPKQLEAGIENGNYNIVWGQVDQYRELYADDPKQTDKVVSAMENSINMYVSKVGGAVTVGNKRDVAYDIYEGLMDEGSNFTEEESIRLYNYVTVDLPKKYQAQQQYRDSSVLAQRDADIAESLRSGQEIPLEQNPPAGMLGGSTAKFYKQLEGYDDKFGEGELSGFTPDQAEGRVSVYKAKVSQGTFDQSDLNVIEDMAADGVVPPGTLAEFEKSFVGSKNPLSQKAGYKKTPQYKGVVSGIKSSAHLFQGSKPQAPKKGSSDEKTRVYAEELANWEMQGETAEAEAILALDDAVVKAYPASIDYNKWWEDYLRDNVNGGSILSNEIQGDTFTGTLGQATVDTFSTLFTNPAVPDFPKRGSKLNFQITNDADYLPSIMREE